jgi:DNA polymerase I-like protein with 3'-5' exonuclease and polymerase domains
MQRGLARIVRLWMYLVATCPHVRALGGLMRLQIHDELVLTAPEETAEDVAHRVVECGQEACEAAGLLVPMAFKGGVGETWHDVKHV